MARTITYLELKPETVFELIDVMNDIYNHERPTLQLEHFILVHHQLLEMKERLHWCEKCNEKYFDHRAGAYRMICEPCETKPEEETE